MFVDVKFLVIDIWLPFNDAPAVIKSKQVRFCGTVKLLKTPSEMTAFVVIRLFPFLTKLKPPELGTESEPAIFKSEPSVRTADALIAFQETVPVESVVFPPMTKVEPVVTTLPDTYDKVAPLKLRVPEALIVPLELNIKLLLSVPEVDQVPLPVIMKLEVPCTVVVVAGPIFKSPLVTIGAPFTVIIAVLPTKVPIVTAPDALNVLPTFSVKVLVTRPVKVILGVVMLFQIIPCVE